MKLNAKQVTRIVLIVAGVLTLLAIGGFLLWSTSPLPADDVALAALESDGDVTVTQEDRRIVFEPSDEPSYNVGFIYYPGGRVDYRAYAPVLRQIAAEGYTVVLVRMPLNLAVTAPNRADEVIAAHPEITTWAIGGHSLGGAMASTYTDNNRDTIDGLILHAAYPAQANTLSGYDGAVVSISADLDGLATPETIEETSRLLPDQTEYTVIAGGNHAGFGSYGTQAGDFEASISQPEQWAQIVEASVGLLDSLHPDATSEVGEESEVEPAVEPTPTAETVESTDEASSATESASDDAAAPSIQDIFTASVTAEGDVLIVTGRVRDVMGNPLPGVAVEFWQTDASGVYDHPGDPDTESRDRGFQFYGTSVTNDDGRYLFRTILPGEYEPRPRHIHVKVRQNAVELLTTQFYFAQDGAGGGVGGSNESLLLAMTQVETTEGSLVWLAEYDVFLVTGAGSGDYAPTASQGQGPYYPVVDVSQFDNDLASVVE